jgi:hypothetical protein
MFEEGDTCLKKMIFDLAQAINHTISESDGVQDAIEAIKEKGYGIDLSLAACIGLYKHGSSQNEAELTEPISIEFNKQDLDFLKSLKLKIDEN